MSGHPALKRHVVRALKDGGRIMSVYSHAGSPGGHNNDRLELLMESGKTVVFDIYSLYQMTAEVKAARRTPVEPKLL